MGPQTWGGGSVFSNHNTDGCRSLPCDGRRRWRGEEARSVPPPWRRKGVRRELCLLRTERSKVKTVFCFWAPREKLRGEGEESIRGDFKDGFDLNITPERTETEGARSVAII